MMNYFQQGKFENILHEIQDTIKYKEPSIMIKMMQFLIISYRKYGIYKNSLYFCNILIKYLNFAPDTKENKQNTIEVHILNGLLFLEYAKIEQQAIMVEEHYQADDVHIQDHKKAK